MSLRLKCHPHAPEWALQSLSQASWCCIIALDFCVLHYIFLVFQKIKECEESFLKRGQLQLCISRRPCLFLCVRALKQQFFSWGRDAGGGLFECHWTWCQKYVWSMHTKGCVPLSCEALTRKTRRVQASLTSLNSVSKTRIREEVPGWCYFASCLSWRGRGGESTKNPGSMETWSLAPSFH